MFNSLIFCFLDYNKNYIVHLFFTHFMSLHENLHSRVMAFGTFDLFHPGHQYYISEAMKQADECIVVVARDHRVVSWKGRTPVDDEEKRKQNIEKHFPGIRVILWDEVDMMMPLRMYKPDILAVWYDQKVPLDRVHEVLPEVSIIRIAGFETDTWKSSKLRDIPPYRKE